MSSGIKSDWIRESLGVSLINDTVTVNLGEGRSTRHKKKLLLARAARAASEADGSVALTSN